MTDRMSRPRYGLYAPNFGKAVNARTLADLAVEAESAEWDGFFLWDHVMHSRNQRLPMVDSLTALAAMAVNTNRIKLGTTITPLARRRPWVVARQTATLDHLSNGRMILGVGLGEPADADFELFGESGDSKVRAEKLDEGLEILTRLWSGGQVKYRGRHFQINGARFYPSPKQKPRIPIWVGGFWPNKKPFQRAARWDGVIPLSKLGSIRPQPRLVRDIITYIRENRSSRAPFDIAVIGWGTGKDLEKNAKKIRPYIDAGITWWLESLYTKQNSLRKLRERILQGPPKLPRDYSP